MQHVEEVQGHYWCYATMHICFQCLQTLNPFRFYPNTLKP
jgi:hypothetical protein